MPSPAKNAFGFNERAIHALKPRATQTDFMDLGLEGFGIRVYPTGRKTFFVRYRFGTGLRRRSLGQYPKATLRRARAEAEAVIGRVAAGEDPQAHAQEERSALSFGELATSYIELHAKARKKSWLEDERMLRRDLLPAWRTLPAIEIRRRDVAIVLDGIVRRGAPIMANRVRALASKIFTFGLHRELVEVNPVAGLPRPSEENRRDRVLSENEVHQLWRLWAAEGSVASFAFRTLLLTAQRKQEVLAMRWADIDKSWWTIPAEFVKNRLAHRVYLSSQALALLEALRPLTGNHSMVFASPRRQDSPISSLNSAKRRSRRAAAIPDWCPHDLRRTAATHMGRMGVTRAVIARVLNHVDSSVTAIYDRSTGEPEIEQALQLWGQRVGEIVRHGPEPGQHLTRLAAS